MKKNLHKNLQNLYFICLKWIRNCADKRWNTKIAHLKQQAKRNLASELELEETICRQMLDFPRAKK